MNKITLPFEINPVCKSYHNRAYPLGVIQQHLIDFDKWLCNKLINFVYYGDNGKFDIYEPDIWSLEDGLTCLQKVDVDYRNVGVDFIEFNKKMLSEGFYITGSYNEFFIPQKRPYHKYDNTHDYILYGFDDKKKIFKSAGYLANQIYNYYDLRYEDYLESIKKIHDEYFWLEYHKFIVGYSAEIKKEDIIKKIEGYLNTCDNSNSMNGRDILGIAACEQLGEYIRGSEGEAIQLRFTRIYMEHKAVMYKRLNTMYKEKILKNFRIVQLYYDNVYIKAQILFALSIKYNLSQKNDILTNMFDNIKSINFSESVILERVVKELRMYRVKAL